MRVLTTAQMREADRITIEEIGVPSLVLMETAGRRVVEAMGERFGDLTHRKVGVLCGSGQNGGDGLVVARLLTGAGVETRVYLCGRGPCRGDAATNLFAARALEIPVVRVTGAGDAEASDATATLGAKGGEGTLPVSSWGQVRDEALSCDLIVDALLGTGLRDPVKGPVLDVITDVNASGRPVVSVDLPSGLAADLHVPAGAAIAAELTVTLAAPKLSLVAPTGPDWGGDVVVADIGIPEDVVATVGGDRFELMTPEDARRLLPVRPLDAHKGDFGHVLVVAGSEGKTGAAVLAALGALRSGAGLVTVATPRRCASVVASLAPEYMVLPLPETETGAIAPAALDQVLAFDCDVIAAGPGLGTALETGRFVEGLVGAAETPLVLDADALNALARRPAAFAPRGGGSVVVTPHPGEMARLADLTTAEVQADRVGVSQRFAREWAVTVVLKGATTLVASPDGSVSFNPTGNPGMAGAGMGDVLTGGLAAWMAQLRDAKAAGRLGVYLHGAAGDLAVVSQGEEGLIASDLLACLGSAARDLRATPDQAESGDSV